MKNVFAAVAVLMLVCGMAIAQTTGDGTNVPPTNTTIVTPPPEISPILTTLTKTLVNANMTATQQAQICVTAKGVIKQGANPREITKLVQSLIRKRPDITPTDIDAMVAMLGVAIEKGLRPDEARTVVAMEALKQLSYNGGTIGMIGAYSVSQNVAAKAASRGETLIEAKKIFLSAKEKAEEIIRERYGDTVSPAAGTSGQTDLRKPRR